MWSLFCQMQKTKKEILIEFNNHSFFKKTFQGGEQSNNRRDFLNVLFSFLTLFLCFQHFHNNLLLNKESALDSVTDTFSTHGPTIGSADMFLRFRQPHENFWPHSTNLHKENVEIILWSVNRNFPWYLMCQV